MRMIKRLIMSTVAFVLLFSSLSYARNEGMSQVGGGKDILTYYYYYEDDTTAFNEWKQVWDNWYYFGEDGISKYNTWAEIDGNWYYFDQWSIMLHDTTTPDGYQVGADGAWITESQTDAPSRTGVYRADDGQIITVKSADDKGIQVSFYGYGEEGWYTQEYTLLFADTEKKRAVYEDAQFGGRDIYTFTEKGIEVSVEPAGGWKMGMYVRQ